MMGCDFCDNARPAVAEWPARDILVEQAAAGSRGAWAACKECHALLLVDDREVLLRHALDLLMKKNRFERGMLPYFEPALRLIHDKYFEARLDLPPRLL